MGRNSSQPWHFLGHTLGTLLKPHSFYLFARERLCIYLLQGGRVYRLFQIFRKLAGYLARHNLLQLGNIAIEDMI